jgi:hypothetical protein
MLAFLPMLANNTDITNSKQVITMKNYIVNYVDKNGLKGFFDAPALNCIGALTDFLAYCLEENIEPITVSVVRHD